MLLLLVLGLGIMSDQCRGSTFITNTNLKTYQKLFGGNKADSLSLIPLCYFETSNDTSLENSLIESNISGPEYDRKMSERNESALIVTIELQIIQLVGLDEKSQTVNLVIATNKYWMDCRLTWDEGNATLNELQLIPSTFKKLNVFNPNVRLLEAVNPKESDDSETKISLFSNGLFYVTQEYSTLFSCSINVGMYPFDIQTCSLTFESVLAENLVNLYFEEDETLDSIAFVGRYQPNEQWTLAVLPPSLSRRKTCVGAKSPGGCFNDGLKFTLVLRRNPSYQLINLLFPAFLIVVISSCVFIIPPGGGDKMGLSVSILLSLYMFSQLMYGKMPETGSFPLLSQYFLVCIGLVTASCLYSSMSAVFVSARPQIPAHVRKFIVILGPIFIFDLIKSKPAKPKTRSLKQKNATDCLAIEETETPERTATEETEETSELQDPAHDSDGFDLSDPDSLTWAALGALLDRIFFVVHLIATVAVMGAYLINGFIPWKAFSALNLTGKHLDYVCRQLAIQNITMTELNCPSYTPEEEE